MITENIGYRKTKITWKRNRMVSRYKLFRSLPGGVWTLVAETTENSVVDTVPYPLNRQRYVYNLEKIGIETFMPETVETSTENWLEDKLPFPFIPDNPEWLAIYRKAWSLTWQGIRHSDAMPAKFSYNDYPDCDITYLWDSCFCTLFQRYAAPAELHPCMKTLDNFYAIQETNGHIPRTYRCENFTIPYKDKLSVEAVNPPLAAWAEWNYYLVSADKNRFERVLPHLIANYQFIDSYMEEKPDHYRWCAGGEGWDNINDKQGEDAIFYYVDLISQQALAARHIAMIASVLGKKDVAATFHKKWEEKKKPVNEIYWNKDKNWFCHLTKDGRFTRKTLAGIWPLLAGIADRDKAEKAVKATLMNPDCFNTSPMPLSTLSKDEPGYNPLGEYWLGAAWINISLTVIRALEDYGFEEEAFELSRRTLDGMAAVYEKYDDFQHSLWECYAPESPAPASHKIVAPDKPGGVREEFRGWTCCLINILIENIMGIYVNAPENKVIWKLRLDSPHGIRNLRFGDIETSLQFENGKISTVSNGKYSLEVNFKNRTKSLSVGDGECEVVL